MSVRDIQGQQTSVINYANSNLYAGGSLTEGALAGWVNGIADKSGASRTDLSYDFRGQVASETVFGKVDSSGNGVPDGTQRKTSYVYDQAGQLLQVIAPRNDSESVRYAFDGLGRLISKVDALGGATTVSYLDASRTVNTTDANRNVSQEVRDAANRLQYEVDAAGTVTKYEYDANGNVVRKTNYATLLAAAALPGSVVADPSRDQVTRNYYDADNRLTCTVDPSGTVTRYEYDANDNVLRKTVHANTAAPGVDAAKQFSLTASQQTIVMRSTVNLSVAVSGNYTFFTTSSNGSRLYLVDGTTVTEVVNNDGTHPPMTVRSRPMVLTAGKTYQLVETYFNSGGAPTNDFGISTAPSGAGSLNNFGVVIGSAALEVFRYSGMRTSLNTLGDPKSLGFTNASNGSVASFVGRVGAVATDVTQLGRVVLADASRDASTQNIYDADDRLIYAIDAAGTVTKTDYDANGNTVQTTVFGAQTLANLAQGKIATQSSTNVGDASRAVDGNVDGVWSNNSVTQTASEANPWWQVDLGSSNLINGIEVYNRTDANPERLANFYVFISQTDLTGRSYNSILADGSVAKYFVSGQALTGLNLPTGAVGRYVRVQLAGTDVLSLAEVKVYGGSYTPDASRDQITRNGFDADNQLIYTVDATGAVTQFDYDANGNVVRKTAYANPIGASAAFSSVTSSSSDQVTCNTYDGANRLIYQVDATGAVTRYDYDANGNVVRKTNYANPIAATAQPGSVLADPSRDQVTRNSYDADNRLTCTVDPTGTVTRYEYDGNDNLVRQTNYANTAIASADIPGQLGMQLQTFVMRTTVSLSVAASGSYTFFTNSGDGSRLYLVDGSTVTEIVNNDGIHPAATVTSAPIALTTGKTYQLVETYLNQTGSLINNFGISAAPAGTSALNNFGVAIGVSVVEVYRYTVATTSLNTAGDPRRLGFTNTSNGQGVILLNRVTALATDATQLGRALLVDTNLDATTHQVYDADDRLIYAIDAAGTVTKSGLHRGRTAVQATTSACGHR